MTAQLESFRPKLTPNARVRLRSDGSCGVFDDVTGKALEVARDQATLIPLLDGTRSIPELVEAHYAEHRFVPFAALDDLLKSLATAGLLDDSAGPSPVTARKRSWMQRATWELAHPRVPGMPFIAIAVSLLAIVAAIELRPAVGPSLSAWDVLLAYPGAVLALSLRRFFQSAGVFAFGERTEHLEVGGAFGGLFFGPGFGLLVLLDPPRRG